jgi:hypothetical protein
VSKPKDFLTKKQAELICDAFSIEIIDGDEESELLKQNNPELYEAESVLLDIAERF